ncbi:Hsp33 family molecular chaperone HslO [Longimicrobium sp.]|uniref:Hsp33 family molecular chaperone HslO n=1 Tax=Longimicrobium sp. TaxID=2029185 RepID=UPI002BE310FA|nr:Hsp33 family molecular chaperone HslO [Longimicrobium sp.]HSU16866.1 Hsp33 family molecular chaperone HslO [Longimicrobium sp.]
MQNGDYMVRATALDGRVRAFALNATGVVSELQRRHGTWPAVSAALGRTAMGALLFSAATLKEEDQALTVEVKGGGPAGRILATANGRGEVRGLVGNPQAHADSRNGKLNVAGVVGTGGYLSVTRDLGMRETYQGTVELQSGEIGLDLAYYLTKSEQTPSAVAVGVFVLPDGSVDAAGGYLVQLLPGLDDDEIAEIERRLGSLPHPTSLVKEGVGPEQVLERVFPDGFELLDRYPVRFHCPCSRERFTGGIVSLGETEIRRIIEEEENDTTEVVCHFCNQAYHFTREDMAAILEAAR